MKAEGGKRVRVLVVGAGSLLGSALLGRKRDGVTLTGIAHGDFSAADIESYDVVLNMAYDPRYMREAYDAGLDFDLKVAESVKKARRHFVMMSTRKIYGPVHQWPVPEDAPKAPGDFYGRNKLETEGRVQALLGPDCTIVRLANVFDFEPNRHTFFGIALTTLRRDGRIVLDTNPFVRKDFIPLTDCLTDILTILSRRPAGVINIGYGTATEIGRIAMWLIEGYGRGELVITSGEMRDEFLLDIGRLEGLIGASVSRTSIRERCLEIGEQLRHA